MKTIYLVCEYIEFNPDHIHTTSLTAYEDKQQAEKYLEYISKKNELLPKTSYGLEQINLINKTDDVIIPERNN